MFTTTNLYLPTYKVSLLKSQVYRAMFSYMARALEAYDLSPPDWTLLGILYEKKALQPTEIANYLRVKPPVVTASLKRLQKKEMIKKNRQSEDGRFSTVTLTKNGREVVSEAEEKMQRDFQEFTKGIAKADISTYFRVLDQVSVKLNERARSF